MATFTSGAPEVEMSKRTFPFVVVGACLALLVPIATLLFSDEGGGVDRPVAVVGGPTTAESSPAGAPGEPEPGPLHALRPPTAPALEPPAPPAAAEVAAHGSVSGPAVVREGATSRHAGAEPPLRVIDGHDAPAGNATASAAETGAASDPSASTVSNATGGRVRVIQPAPRDRTVRAKAGGRPATHVSSDPDGVYVSSPGHMAAFTTNGLSLTPRDARGGAALEATVRYRLARVARGENVLFAGATARPDLTANHVRYQRGPFVEQYVACDRGLEQLFSFEAIPAGTGDLVIRGTIETLLAGAAQPDGSVRFTNPVGPGVVFGKATAFDGAGRSVDVPLVLAGTALELRVPGEWLQHATAPLLVDPLIGSDVQLTSFADDETQVDIAYNAQRNEFVIVYVQGGDTLMASRLSPSGGVLQGGVTLDGTTPAKRNPAICWSEAGDDQYLVAYVSVDINNPGGPALGGVRVLVMDETLTITASTARLHVWTPTDNHDQDNPDIAYDASRDRWTVVFDDQQSPGGGHERELLVEQVLTTGAQQGAAVLRSANDTDLKRPAIAHSTTSDVYLVSYTADDGNNYDVASVKVDGALSSSFAWVFTSEWNDFATDVCWNSALNRFLLVWHDNNEVRAQQATTGGIETGSIIKVSTVSNQGVLGPRIVFLAGPNTYLASYYHYSPALNATHVWAREIRGDLTFVKSDFRLSTSTTTLTEERNPAIAVNTTDARFFVAWEDERSLSDYDLWGRRFASDTTVAPEAPVITSPANGSEVADRTPLVQGTADPLTTIEVLVDGSPTVPATTITTSKSGTWQVSIAQTLNNGATYSITARATGPTSLVSPQSSAVSVTIIEYTVTLSGTEANFLLEPERGAIRTTTVTISDVTQSVTVRTTNGAKFKLLSSGVEVDQLTGVTNGQVIQMIGLESGPGPSGTSFIRAETPGGTVKAEKPVLTRALSFVIDAQSPTRNAAFTGGGLADAQDGACLDLGRGLFAWSYEVLPAVQGRNGLAPDWTVRLNSRAHSRGGNFGVSPLDLFCFMRVRKDASSQVVWQESSVREYTFDTSATGGKTARARYEVVKESGSEVVLRAPDGSTLRFHPFDDTFKAGALTRIETRFGDRIDVALDARGFATEVYDAFGRQWTLTYDDRARLASITESSTTLLGRTCSFTYDAQSRLTRIDTTPVLTDGGIGNTFTSGKPVVLTYDAPVGDPRLDTNVRTIRYPAQVLDATNVPRLQLSYGTSSGFDFDKVTAQTWGGTNTSGVAAGGTLAFTYTDLAPPSPGPNDPVNETEVFDRNGNRTVYRFNQHALPVRTEEYTNRDIRGTVDDPASFLTQRLFNADEELVEVTHPLGNEVQFTYDTANVDRYAHGNLLQETRIADATRGGDGHGSSIADIVRTWRYEPIFQQPRLVTGARGNDAAFVPPIADDEANVEDLDFNLNNVTNEVAAGETLRARRYTTWIIYDYQERSTSNIQSLATAQGVTVTSTQAAALSLHSGTGTVDRNQDGLTTQQVGRPIEVRAPTVTLPSGLAQQVRTNYQWDAFGQLLAEIDPEGYVDDHAYYPENAPCRPGQAVTPNPPGRTLSSTTGGYLKEVVRDNRTLIRTPEVSTARAQSKTTQEHNNAGVQTRRIDPRGIVHTSVVNERNQVQVSIQAESLALTAEEPRSLAVLHHETRTHYDANDNVKKTEVENLVPPDPGSPYTTAPQAVSGNPWIETTMVYDLLDDLVELTQEVSNGETRRVRGVNYAVGAAESITTRYRYSRNQEQVLVISPEAVAGTSGQENNVTSSILDERGLPWKSTRGGVDPQFTALSANADIALATGVTTTARTSTVRTRVDANGNVRFSIDAEDNGTPHDGTGGLLDTDDPTVAGTQRGDPTETRYDGFDRVLVVVDAMGYQQVTGNGTGGAAYDPDSNALTHSAVGPAGDNLRGGGVNDRLLARGRSFHDELSRVYRSEQDYFRTPQTFPPTIESVYAFRTDFDRCSRELRTHAPALGTFVETDFDGLDRAIARRTNAVNGAAGDLRPSEVVTKFDDAGNAVQVIETERNVDTGTVETFYTDTLFDAANRADLVVSNHFSGNTANASRMEYDSMGLRVATIDANATGTTTQAVSRPASITLTINSTGNAVALLHDNLGRELLVARELRVGHDGSAAIDTSNPRNNDGYVTTLCDWDKNSHVVSRTDDPDTSLGAPTPNPSVTAWAYDDLDRCALQSNADLEVQLTTFDRDSNELTFTDENGSVFTRSFDDLDRLTQVSIARATGVEGTTLQTFEYDGLSRATEKTDDNGAQDDSVVTCSFDSLSREQEQSQKIGALAARLVTCEFDQNSNLIQLTYPGVIGAGGRRKVTYGYREQFGGGVDSVNRLERIEEGAGSGTGNAIVPTGTTATLIAKFSYAGVGRLTRRTYGDAGLADGGPVLTVTYDALRRPTRLVHEMLVPNPLAFATYDYAFDKVGNRLNEQFTDIEEGPTQDIYQYDSLGRLTFEGLSAAAGGITNNQAANPATGGSPQRTWDQLDGANNWTRVVGSGTPSRTMTANEMNEYTVVDGVSRTHDDNGNLTNDGTRTYAYDAFNRLVRVRRNSDGQDIAFYAYDAEGRRVRRLVQNSGSLNTTATYLYLGAFIVEEGDSSAAPVRQYVWGGGLLQYKIASSTYYCHDEGRGSITRITAQAGDVVEERDFTAYGEFVQGGTDTGLPMAYGGLLLDQETGLHLSSGRFYDAALGRFTSREVVGLAKGPALPGNIYACPGTASPPVAPPPVPYRIPPWWELPQPPSLPSPPAWLGPLIGETLLNPGWWLRALGEPFIIVDLNGSATVGTAPAPAPQPQLRPPHDRRFSSGVITIYTNTSIPHAQISTRVVTAGALQPEFRTHQTVPWSTIPASLQGAFDVQGPPALYGLMTYVLHVGKGQRFYRPWPIPVTYAAAVRAMTYQASVLGPAGRYSPTNTCVTHIIRVLAAAGIGLSLGDPRVNQLERALRNLRNGR